MKDLECSHCRTIYSNPPEDAIDENGIWICHICEEMNLIEEVEE